jgi:hypothetical protein
MGITSHLNKLVQPFPETSCELNTPQAKSNANNIMGVFVVIHCIPVPQTFKQSLEIFNLLRFAGVCFIYSMNK